MLFDNLSPKTDFSSKLTIKLEIISGNILYITHEIDKIKKIVTKLELDSRLQKQIDEYYGGTGEAHLGTSPQTDQDEQ